METKIVIPNQVEIQYASAPIKYLFVTLMQFILQ